MLTEQEIQRLTDHIAGIIHSVIIPEITPLGCILGTNPDGSVSPDQVTTHHLVELCLELNSTLFQKVIDAACNWFLTVQFFPQNPFLITTLSSAQKLSREDANAIITKFIVPSQRPSGCIDLYAGFLDGGSIFSTLWAIRILSILSSQSDIDVSVYIDNAFKFIETHWTDIHRVSFKGYYCELVWTAKSNAIDRKAEQALHEILGSQAPNGFWDDSPLYTAYILGDLALAPSHLRVKVQDAIEIGLRTIFNLQEQAQSLPPALKKPLEPYLDSPHLQLCIRSTISAIRYLRNFCGIDSTPLVISNLLGNYPLIYFKARASEREYKKMVNEFGSIREKFSHLENNAKSIFDDSPFEKNVFVMMPFRQQKDERFENIEQIIRAELKKKGFRAWLASDKTLSPQLWDNVASFLLACKYGIAVFTRDERGTQIAVEEFNPNVSLELGFFISRGKKVLILKDSALPRLPTDLLGHLYQEFDLNQVNRHLPKIIKAWVNEIENDN
jgi:hypothetical protein